MKAILVLEDEPSVMAVIRLVLSNGYAVLESTTASEAFQRFHERTTKIDLLIADVTLPVSSGIRVALELRSLDPSLRIILASGYPPSIWPDQELAELSEVPPVSVDFLEKPFLPATLRTKVEGLIGPPEQCKAASSK